VYRYNAHEYNLKVWRTFHEIKVTRFSKKIIYAHDGYRNGLGTLTSNDELCTRQNLLEIVINFQVSKFNSMENKRKWVSHTEFQNALFLA